MSPKPLDYGILNENVKKVQYAVRGELYLRASKGREKDYFHKHRQPSCPWTEATNIPSSGSSDLQFICFLTSSRVLIATLRGVPGIKKEVAEFIGRRDGYPSDPELIFLTGGATIGVMQILNTIIRDGQDGALNGGSLVPYYLEEAANWVSPFRQSVAGARSRGITV